MIGLQRKKERRQISNLKICCTTCFYLKQKEVEVKRFNLAGLFALGFGYY